mgnify:CR=1 FL=1
MKQLNNDINSINEAIRNMCGRKNVTYIDIYSKLVDNTGVLNVNYTKDGLHINEDGYKVITSELVKYID